MFEAHLDYCWSVFSQKYPQCVRPRLTIQSLEGVWGCIRPNVTPPDLRLNSRLRGASDKRVRQVIFHELCHLVHPNHSRAFWDDLESFSEEKALRDAYKAQRLNDLTQLIDEL